MADHPVDDPRPPAFLVEFFDPDQHHIDGCQVCGRPVEPGSTYCALCTGRLAEVAAQAARLRAKDTARFQDIHGWQPR